jgi:hypothetical protein
LRGFFIAIPAQNYRNREPITEIIGGFQSVGRRLVPVAPKTPFQRLREAQKKMYETLSSVLFGENRNAAAVDRIRCHQRPSGRR